MTAQLTLAKTIADNPTAYSIDQLRDAYAYLYRLRSNGGVRNSERASEKLERRLLALHLEQLSRLPRAAIAKAEWAVGYPKCQ